MNGGVSLAGVREYAVMPIHDEVKTAILKWLQENDIDIAYTAFLRFLICYACTDPYILKDFDELATTSIEWLDSSNIIASDGATDGRIRERLNTGSKLILNMSGIERYKALLCGLHALGIVVDELVV